MKPLQIIIALTGIVLIIIGISIGKKDTNTTLQNQSEQVMTEDTSQTTSTEMQIETTQTGSGPEIQDGQTAVVHYTGTFADGSVFDSSKTRGMPFEFTVGAGQVISGWDIGVKGMQVGEVRKLVLPPQYAYGEAGVGPIPPNSTLLFEVELLEIK